MELVVGALVDMGEVLGEIGSEGEVEVWEGVGSVTFGEKGSVIFREVGSAMLEDVGPGVFGKWFIRGVWWAVIVG